jgi:hypothetical protein
VRQPNPHFRSAGDLNPRDTEHYHVAQSFGGLFTSAQFRERYSAMFPTRRKNSIIPSDYCFNRENKGNHLYPRFLIWQRDSVYTFVGLSGGVKDD